MSGRRAGIRGPSGPSCIAARGGTRGALVLPPILAMAFLTGHPQEWYYLVIVLSVWAAADAFRAWRRDGHRAAVWACAGWAGVLAWSLGLVAVELLPDLAAQRWVLQSGRMAMGPASRYHLHSPNVMQLLSPKALGGPADYFGRDNYWETVLSIGLLPLVLAVIARVRHPDRALTRGWADPDRGGGALRGRADSSASSPCSTRSPRAWTVSGSPPGRSSWSPWARRCSPGSGSMRWLARPPLRDRAGWSRIGIAIVAVGLILGRIVAGRVSPGASGILETSRDMPWAFAASRVVSDWGLLARGGGHGDRLRLAPAPSRGPPGRGLVAGRPRARSNWSCMLRAW